VGVPHHELFGLTGQLRRAAVSVPSNVAEESSRPTTRALINHAGIALGSLAEVETCMEIALRLGYLSQKRCGPLFELAGEVGRLLNGLMHALKAKKSRSPSPITSR
jgi:four helix bundle protein